jgi:hypothetical protein
VSWQWAVSRPSPFWVPSQFERRRLQKERKYLRMSTWKHVNTILGNQDLYINGVLIPINQWKKTGEKVKVKDPIMVMNVLWMYGERNQKERNLGFAGGEISNSVWVIFQKL